MNATKEHLMSINSPTLPTPAQTKPIQEQVLELGLERIIAYRLPDAPKTSRVAVRKRRQRTLQAEAGLERVDLSTTPERARVMRKIHKEGVTVTLIDLLPSHITGVFEEFEFATGHNDDGQPPPGVELWVRVMLSLPDVSPPQSQTHGSRSSHEYKLGRYVLQLKGWRRWIFELAYRLTAFKLPKLIPKNK